MHKLFYKSGEFCIFEDRSLKRMGRMTRPTIFACRISGTLRWNDWLQYQWFHEAASEVLLIHISLTKQHLPCRVWTTVTPCWLVFHFPHWHRFRECSTQRHVLFWILSRATVWPQFSKSCTGYQSQRGSSTSCTWWSTSRLLDTRRCTTLTYWHQLPNADVPAWSALRASCRGHVDESATNRTASMEHAADGAEAAAIDHYVSSSTENIFVPVCQRTPERLMIVLWCALGLQ